MTPTGTETLASALAAGDLAEPQNLLGAHRLPDGGWVIRVHHPDASSATCRLADGRELACRPAGPGGLFEARVASGEAAPDYRVCFGFADGSVHEQDDPYRFPATIGDTDLYLFAEGSHRRLWEVLGARPMQIEGVPGVRFAVWAPRARRVSVVGEFCRWDGRRLPMRRLGPSGVFELFVPGIDDGALYKFEIRTR